MVLVPVNLTEQSIYFSDVNCKNVTLFVSNRIQWCHIDRPKINDTKFFQQNLHRIENVCVCVERASMRQNTHVTFVMQLDKIASSDRYNDSPCLFVDSMAKCKYLTYRIIALGSFSFCLHRFKCAICKNIPRALNKLFLSHWFIYCSTHTAVYAEYRYLLKVFKFT